MRRIERPSPNHDARPLGTAIDMLVLHYTGMPTAEGALARLCDPEAKVSAHYTIDRDGTVFVHVPEDRRAWHAGASFWAGRDRVNDRSIGIELVNPGHEFGYVPFTEEQIGALTQLGREILARHPIPATRVLGHSDVAPARKTDPGELFPWQRLAEAGIGLWPSPPTCGEVDLAKPNRVGGGVDAVAQSLSRFGYGVPPLVEVPLETVIAAFQRHFRPSKIDGLWDDECAALIAELLPA
jgi:N-acetylmuramoyl-L-alanine amidase